MADWGRLKLMYSCKVIRYLRLKHGISIREISEAAGISMARYSEIELEKCKNTPYQLALINVGFQTLILKRKESITLLEENYEKYKDMLLEQKEELS